MSASNAAGRLGWSTASDFLGRKNTYFLFGTGLPLAACAPLVTASFVSNPDTVPLYVFCGGTMAMISFYGGLFSVLPAYLADIFGQKHVGAIHGRVLTAWAAAAVLGPNMLAAFRKKTDLDAINSLVDSVSADQFQAAFGASKDNLSELVEAKSVTISRMMEIVPEGVLDPTPTLYARTSLSACPFYM